MTIIKTIAKSAAFAAALTMSASLVAINAWAAKTDLTLGIVLEPPHLDPTAGAAAGSAAAAGAATFVRAL